MRRELAHYPKQYLCTYTTPLLQLTEKCHHCSWPIYLCTRTHSSEFFPQSKDKNECNKSVPFNSTPLPPLSLFLFCFKGSLDFFIAAAAMWLQSCLTLCDPTDGSPPGSSVPGTLQARILEWVAIFFSPQEVTKGPTIKVVTLGQRGGWALLHLFLLTKENKLHFILKY